jgi:hypothetical protein
VDEGQGVVVPVMQDIGECVVILRGGDKKEHYGDISVYFESSLMCARTSISRLSWLDAGI